MSQEQMDAFQRQLDVLADRQANETKQLWWGLGGVVALATVAIVGFVVTRK